MSLGQIVRKLLSSNILILLAFLFYSSTSFSGGKNAHSLSIRDRKALKNVNFDNISYAVLKKFIRKKHPSDKNEMFRVSMLCKPLKKRKHKCEPVDFEMLAPLKK